MNHSPRFWAVVESIYPAHQSARKALRGHIATLPLIELA
ncbi:MAG: YgjP-like metallopeptidase domain-containing protein [Fluviibacter sp.]